MNRTERKRRRVCVCEGGGGKIQEKEEEEQGDEEQEEEQVDDEPRHGNVDKPMLIEWRKQGARYPIHHVIVAFPQFEIVCRRQFTIDWARERLGRATPRASIAANTRYAFTCRPIYCTLIHLRPLFR